MTQAISRAGGVRRVAVLLAVVAGLALAGCTSLGTSATSTPSPAASTAAQPTAAAIGDSIAIGWGVPADDAWPLIAATRLGWDLTDLGEGGAGFTKPGVNTHDFDDQVSAAIRLRPQVIIVAATRNDAATAAASPATVTRDTAATIERLSTALPHTTIIGMGSVWGATAADRSATVVDEALKSAVLSVGGHWLPLGQTFLGRSTLLQADGIHPTSAGQELLGQTVADAIVKARIEPGPARG